MTVPSTRRAPKRLALRWGAAVLVIAAGPLVVDAATKPPNTERASVSTAGAEADAECYLPSISADGRYVAFQSPATTLVAGDDNAKVDVFVRDRKTQRTTRVSVGSQPGGGGGTEPSISANGRYVAYESYATDLVPDDDNGQPDVFVRDMKSGVTTRIQVSAVGSVTNDEISGVRISGDGRFVVFSSYAPNAVTGDGNGESDVFVHDRRRRTTVRVSVSTVGQEGAGDSFNPSISATGRHVAFVSRAENLVMGDANGVADVFVRDLKKGSTTLVSRSTTNAPANGRCTETAISANGRIVAFASEATSLANFSFGIGEQIYLHDSKTGVTTRISGFTKDVEGDAPSYSPSITPNGRWVAFASKAANLVEGDGNGRYDDFVHDAKTGRLARVSVDVVGAEVAGDSYGVVISANGRYVAFESESATLVPGDLNSTMDVFTRRVR